MTHRESCEQERSSTESVNGENGGEGKDKVDGAEAETGVESLSGSVSRLNEDSGRVEGNDYGGPSAKEQNVREEVSGHVTGVCWGMGMREPLLTVDTTHLLGKHDSRGGKRSSSDSWNSEQLCESREIVSALDNLVLDGDLNVGVVHVPSGHDLGVSESAHRLVSSRISSLLHEPSGRLGAEEDEDGEREGGDESGSELQSPCDSADVFDSGIGAETEEDTEGSPQLPSTIESVHVPACELKTYPMTRAPLMLAGASSAAYIGTVAALAPIPIPRTNRTAASSCQV